MYFVHISILLKSNPLTKQRVWKIFNWRIYNFRKGKSVNSKSEKYYSLPTAFMRVLQSPDMLFMDIPWKTGGWGFYLPMIIMVLEPCVWLETISHTTDHLFGFSFSWSPPLIAIHINRVGFLHLPTFTTYLCRYTAKISTVDMHQSELWSEIRIRTDLIT